MTLSLEINDEELNEMVSQGVKNLSEETIADFAKQAISTYLSDPKTIEYILFDRHGSNGYYYADYSNPRKWFLQMLSNTFSEEEIKEYRSKFLSAVDNNKNEIIMGVLATMFSSMLLQDNMKYDLARVMSKVFDNN